MTAMSTTSSSNGIIEHGSIQFPEASTSRQTSLTSLRSETSTIIQTPLQTPRIEIDDLHPSIPPRQSSQIYSTGCGSCHQPVTGQFVRAMSQVFHLDCFRCKDCDTVVAQKFFPVEDAEGIYPLCERDYFARLDLICAKCDQALRSSYITACGEKYHVEHFTCSVCDTLFGPNDSYYEHGGKVYCHFHYSTEFAVKCVGCETAILKQFVEMNRNGRDECWHPECYMIHKFWNVRLSRAFNTPSSSAVSSVVSLIEPNSETHGSPEELKQRQAAMEIKVQQIWHVLSAYEESSAACISDMLRAVNSRELLEVIILAEKFILHVETLFAIIDDLEAQFMAANAKGMSNSREAKQLCRKLVNFFSMLSTFPQTETQELLTLVTQLAHYLKILIRSALTGALKLERDHGNQTAMTNSLARLHLLFLDNADPRVAKRGDVPEHVHSPDEPPSPDLLTHHPTSYTPSTAIAYGYTSLASEVTGETTLRGPQKDDFIPLDHCIKCQTPVEEDCVRFGMFLRWHTLCVECHCGESLGKPPRLEEFFFDSPSSTLCINHRTPTCGPGFKSVSKLEQYAFLLHVALRRLYVHFRIHHGIPPATERSSSEPVKRMKSVTLDRKLSSTARLPQRSTVVESPAGRIANENGQVVSARMSHLNVTEAHDVADDVIRPPFARNNTSVFIVNDTPAEESTPRNDSITLNDILLTEDPPHEGPLLSELTPLQSLIIKHFALLLLQKSAIGHLIEMDEVLELLESRKNQWWNKIFKGNAKKDHKKKVFGVPIEILVERTGSDSQQGASNNLLRVPEFIEEIVSTMRQMDMAVEGIFRKNGNIRRLAQIAEQLDKDSTTVNLSEENPVQLAALLKRFLREMPDPLLTFRLHKLFCAAASIQNIEERKKILHLLVVLLPRYNRDTMEVLFVFLKWVASFSYRDEETGSRMDIPNLATVICPSILYAKGANAAKDESFIAITAVQQLMENQDEYYQIPPELLFVIDEKVSLIFTKEIDLPPKEIHKHCSKYLSARARVPPNPNRMSVYRSDGNLSASSERHPVNSNSSSNINNSRPTSWIQGQHGSQQSLRQGGPFHGREGRDGSAPSSPGPGSGPGPGPGIAHSQEGRVSMDRERSWTPV